MIQKALAPYPARHYDEGIRVAAVGVRRNHPRALDPAIKSSNLLNNILAVREAQARGCDEPLLLNQEGYLAEGASTNVFVVMEGALLTPPLSAGILAGITREVVIELAAGLGVPCHQKPLHLDTLLGADEAFMTSTTREIVPVRQVDDALVGDGRPGPYTSRMMDAFHAYAVAVKFIRPCAGGYAYPYCFEEAAGYLPAAGATNQEIAKRLGCNPVTVGKWRTRFAQMGVDGLHDEPRPGKPRSAPACGRFATPASRRSSLG